MFGYIRPEKPELKIKEYDEFRAFYCGICKSIAKNSGQIARLTLSYDATFLALLFSSVSNTAPEKRVERCVVHPVQKRNIYKNDKAIDYAADVNIILMYHSLLDKWKDEKLVLSIAGTAALSRKYNKLTKKYPFLCDIIEKKLKKLSKLEEEKCSSVDQAAEPFAQMMAEIMEFCPVIEDEKTKKVLRWLGYNIGKWVYIIDAFDDIEKDLIDKSYNPLLYQYEYHSEKVCEFKNRIRNDVEFILIYSLNEIGKAYELLEVKRNKDLIENIVFMGMLRQTEIILSGEKRAKVKQSRTVN